MKDSKGVSDRAVAYVRVSSQEQKDEGFSIQAQKRLLTNYSKKKRLKVVKLFEDVETAKTSGRVRFKEMVSFLIDNPSIKHVLVEKTDRLYRNISDWATVDDMMQSKNLLIHFVKENEVLSNDSHSHTKFIHGIKVVMAKNYIDNLSEEVKKGMREKAEAGEWPSLAPLGYINDKESHTIERDVNRAPMIKRLFELYATGNYSLKKLRVCAKDIGLKTRTGQNVSKATLYMILRNPLFCGYFYWKGIRYEGDKTKALITTDLYNCVQDALRRDGKPKSRKQDFSFSGLMRCGTCGCQITAQIQRGKYVYYHCTRYKGNCHQPYVRQEVLDEKFGQIIRAIKIDSGIVDWIIEALKSSHSEERRFYKAELTRLERQFDQVQNRLDKSYEDKLDGRIDNDYWISISNKWREEQDTVMSRMNDLRHSNRDYVDQGVRIIEIAQQAHTLYVSQTPQEKRRLLNTILSNCTLKGITLYPTYRKPFDLIVDAAKTRIKLPRLDSN